ncbi:hypothetical protein ABC382_00985 [Lysinibacillus sp. 1P01SD]|uniref:hypothetical protein n=1 Tax=Lysinibacillus sp. 1P01SD TaxID=3132285 RepID=UPI0039A2CC03
MTTVIFDLEQVYLVSNQGENLNITVEFVSDASIDHPRNHTVTEWLGTMYTANNQPRVLGESVFEMSDSLRSNMEQTFAETVGKPSDYIYLPLYVNESNMKISTTPLSDVWDFGFIGFIAVSKQKAREEYGLKRITKQWKEQILNDLLDEVRVLDDYLSGNTFGVVVRHYDDEGNKVFEDKIMGCYGTGDALKIASDYTGVLIENIEDAIVHSVLYMHPNEDIELINEAVVERPIEDWRVEITD